VTQLGAKPASSGAASFSTVLLAAGVHQLTAYYRDEANLITGTSNAVTQTVKAAAGGAFLTTLNLTVLPPLASSAVVGDFNHDGKVDFALGNPNGAGRVALGNGDGTFQPLASLPGSPVAAADFNGDGNTDLLVVSSGNATVLFGNGDGTFRPGPVAASGSVVAVGDFNGDGKPDLMTVVTTFGNIGGADPLPGYLSYLALLPGNGDGTFGAPVTYAFLGNSTVGPGAPSLVVTDVNGDGKPDTLAVNAPNNPSLFVIPGGGNGTAQNRVGSRPALPGVGVLSTVISGDFNGDGKTDLALGGRASGTNTATTWILLGNGDGTFQPLVAYPFGSAMVSGDFNGDGFTDFVVVDGNGNAMGILQGKGDGAFQQGPAVSAAVPLAVADFNGDGKADILTYNPASGAATVLLGATPTFAQPASITATGGTPQFATAGTAFLNALTVVVKDASGLPVSGATVIFAVPTTGASATLSRVSVLTDSSGMASVTATANNVAGSYVVTASAGALSTTFSLTNLATSSNLALGKIATQSSTLPGYPFDGAQAAVDGSTDGRFFDTSVTATNLDANAWWQVDLGVPATVSSIVVWNRTDCCGSRLSDYWVFVSSTPFLPTDTPSTLQNRAGTFASHQTAAPIQTSPIAASALIAAGGALGRYVRVQLTGADYLSLAEVQVFGTPGSVISNLAQGKTATQSSTLPGYPTDGAAAAVDGNTDGNFFDGSVTATNLDSNAWWQVDLGASAAVSYVVVWNRTDCCSTRLSDYWVFISDTPFLPTDTPATLQGRAGTFSSHQAGSANPSTVIAAGAQGQYVRVQLAGANYLSLAEVQAVGAPAGAGPDLAQGKAATQSSVFPGYATDGAAAAVDGNADGNFGDGSVTATNLDSNAWWQVDLGASTAVRSIVIWNRTDCCGTRLNDYWVFVSDTPFLATDTPATLQNRAGTFAAHATTAPNPSTTIDAGAQGRYVRVQLTGANYLSLAEVQVFGQ
jgi:hypothetical protein